MMFAAISSARVSTAVREKPGERRIGEEQRRRPGDYRTFLPSAARPGSSLAPTRCHRIRALPSTWPLPENVPGIRIQRLTRAGDAGSRFRPASIRLLATTLNGKYRETARYLYSYSAAYGHALRSPQETGLSPDGNEDRR